MNKFLVKHRAPLNWTSSPGIMQAYVDEQLKLQAEIRQWCTDRLGAEEGYPTWQFADGVSYPDDNSKDFNTELYTGVFIFDDEARTAFKLKYGI